ncbi:MAG TPA: hypothetical protein VF167_10230 [Longimicrobiaceae bacterium]
MEDFGKPSEEAVRCEESARHVLQAYRERRRRRRADDSYFGSAAALLEQVEEGVDATDLERRRSEILEDGGEAGMPRDLVELLYDIAREEGLDPGLALELVKSGLGIVPPTEGVSNESTEPSSDPYLPPWMFPPSPPDHLLRERTLHMSFRRLRSFLERYHDIDEAFRQFAAEPDVGHVGY